MAFTLTSTVFYRGGCIPARFTADGANVSPTLAWSGTPPGTQSLALVCSDPDSPGGTCYHWALYGIPPHEVQLREGFPPGAEHGPIRQAINDFGQSRYNGPAPPLGHRAHHYHFRLYALGVGRLALTSPVHACDVETAAQRHSLAQAELIGTYAR